MGLREGGAVENRLGEESGCRQQDRRWDELLQQRGEGGWG